MIIDCITKACEYIFTANSIPSIPEELVERRIYQDKAIGQCYRLLQELQYTIETLPVNINKYISFIEGIEKEIKLLKVGEKEIISIKRTLINRNKWGISCIASGF